MNATSAPRTHLRRAAAAGILAIGLALAGCQSGGSLPAAPAPAPAGHHFPANPKALTGVDIHRPADRVAEEIERNQARMDELAKRFAGVPADRVEEQLARESAAAQ